MKKVILTSLFVFVNIFLFSQNEFVMGKQSVFKTSRGLFYDDGGKNGNVSAQEQIATFEALEGSIEIYFAEFDIPYGAEMRVFNGNSIHDELVAIFHKGDKIYNVKYPAITIQYIPSKSNLSCKGWKGIIIPSTIDKGMKTLASKPESDCPNALSVCSNTTINTSANQYDDTGLINDDVGSCYSGTGSGGSVWYTFTPQSNGPLDFNLTPLGTTDYDFVLWDITAGCANKVQLSCNFSGTSGQTGLSSAGTSNSEVAAGIPWCLKVNVLTTKVYALCINYYGGTNGGFNLTFKNEAGSVDVWDVTPPSILNAYTANCSSTNSLSLNFSELVQCSTIQNGDFTIPGYSFTVSNTYCNTANGTTHVDLLVSPALTSGSYTLNGVNILDKCGNNMNSNYVITLGVAPNPTISAAAVVCKNPFFFGFTYSPASQVLTANGGTQYIWTPSLNTQTLTVSPTATTIYTVTVLQGACAGTATRQVIVEQVVANAGPDQTICAGFPTLLTAAGGGTYQWQSGTSASGPWTNIAGATNNTLSVSPAATIWYRVIVTGPNGCSNNDVIKVTTGAGSFGITASKAFACLGESITLSLPAGITSYTWSTATSANAALVTTPLSTTNYTATSTTAGCAGSATITIPVRPIPVAAATSTPGTACIGIPVSLSATPSSYTTTVAENFELVNGFTLINGANNKWYNGTAAFANGTKGLYIGTAVGNNNYDIGTAFGPKAATNFALKDYTVTSYCNANLSFYWKGAGQATKAELSVWLVPTSFTPVAGTPIVASASNKLLGGPYSGQLTYQQVTISLSAYAGQAVRIVFQWMNTGAAILGGPVLANPAAAIDDVVFVDSDTFGYSWTSNPVGLSSTLQNVVTNPVVPTNYSITVTRCDGCVSLATTSVGLCTVLPIELISFNGNCVNSEVNLEWSTASEINTNYCVIEKSKDGLSWIELTRVYSIGNSFTIKNYFYVDKDPFYNETYYRLVQVDKMQNSKAYELITVQCITSIPSISCYPNPTANSLTMEARNIDGSAIVLVYNVLGQKVKEISFGYEKTVNGQNKIDISELSDGLYSFKFESKNCNNIFKIIKSN